MLKLDFNVLFKRELGISLRSKEKFFTKTFLLALFFSLLFHLLFFGLFRIAVFPIFESHTPLPPAQIEIDLGLPKSLKSVFAEEEPLSSLLSPFLAVPKNILFSNISEEPHPDIIDSNQIDYFIPVTSSGSLYPVPLSSSYQPVRVVSSFPLSEKSLTLLDTALHKTRPTEVAFFIFNIIVEAKTGELRSWELIESYGKYNFLPFAEESIKDISFLPLDTDENEGILQLIIEREGA